MKILDVRNAQKMPDGAVLCDVDVESTGGVLHTFKFCARESDPSQTSKIVMSKLTGVDLPQFVDDATIGEKWERVRSERDRLLLACDWTQVKDCPKCDDPKWLSYRQALRDITTQLDPDKVIWPVPPEGVN